MAISSESQAFRSLEFWTLPGRGEVFEEVSESTLQPGDIVLFPWENRLDFRTGIFKHAAVYCGDGEVIHFQNTNFPGNYGRISKEGFQPLKMKRGKCQIYRKKGGIDLQDFQSRVKKAMTSEAHYELLRNNCMHFALYLLGLEVFCMQQAKPPNDSCNDGSWSCAIM